MTATAVPASMRIHLVAVVVDGDAVLLVRRGDPGRWQLPEVRWPIGGNPAQAIRAAVQDMTGVVVSPVLRSGVRAGASVTRWVFSASPLTTSVLRPGARWLPRSEVAAALPPVDYRIVTAGEDGRPSAPGIRRRGHLLSLAGAVIHP